MMRTSSLAVSVGMALLVAPASGFAQPDADQGPVRVEPALPTGTRTYAPGRWGLVEVAVVNRSDRPAKVLSSLFFTGNSNEQYGRELWVPGRSRRFTWHPIYVPADLPEGSSVEFRSVVFERTGADDRLVQAPTGEVLLDGLLPVDRDGSITGWIGDDASAEEDPPPPNVGDMIVAARVGVGLPRKLVGLHGLALPPDAAAFDGIEHLVLSGDRPLSEPSGLAAVRQWVRRGGRLWVVLTDVSPSLVERLFGDDCRVQTVDRVGLTEVRIEGVGPAAGSSDREAREFETPVEMVRVLAEGVEVTHTVEGWPAAFWQKVGRGEVLFTTVASAGWVRPRGPQDRKAISPLLDSVWLPVGALAYNTERLLGHRESPSHSADDWKPLLEERIGYRIVSRGTVSAVLGLSCAALVVAAVWLGRHGRLERLGWAAPLMSLASAAALAAVGTRSGSSLASSAAEGQLIETTPGSAVAQVSGLVMLFNRQTAEVELGAEDGGILLPDMTGFAGEPRRMIWTDWDRWHWENLTLPRGVRVARFQKDVRLESPVTASGVFGPDGFAGRVSGPMRGLSDLVLATPGGTLAPGQSSEGAFRAGPQDVLAPGAFISESLLSDTQRRRQDLYRRLLAPGERSGFRERPTLLAWVRPTDLGFIYPVGSERAGEALAVMPLEIGRTPPGTRVTIPSPFVAPEPIQGTDGRPPSPLFDRRTGEPVEYATSIEAWTRFRMPDEVVPLDLDEAQLTLTVAGAARSLEVLGRPGGKVEPLKRWESPAGSLELVIRSSDVLKLDDQGGLLLGVRIEGEPSEGRTRNLRSYWRVESLRLEASGRTRDQ